MLFQNTVEIQLPLNEKQRYKMQQKVVYIQILTNNLRGFLNCN